MMYGTLAFYYDELLGDNDSLALWTGELESRIEGRDILELACGSGEMALMLADRGYNVLATDLSSSMIEVAGSKRKGDNPKFEVMDMNGFSLPDRYDAIICFCDSFNYLNDYDEVKAMFENVRAHLKEGGIFMFDTHHPARLDEFEDEYIEEGYIRDLPYIWTILSDRINSTLMEHFAFYTEEGLIEEDHLQHVFDIDRLVSLLAEAGFEVSCDREFIEDEKVLITGRRI